MVNGVSTSLPNLPAAWSGTPAGKSFVESLRSAIDEVDLQQGDAQNQVMNLLEGRGEDVHTAMIAVERAELSFQLMMELRNKVVAAYQEVARMQF